MTDSQAEGQQDERMRGLARESALRTQVAELKDSLAAAWDDGRIAGFAQGREWTQGGTPNEPMNPWRRKR